MKLNIDCVRDIMLWAEAITTPTQLASYVDTDAVASDSGFLYINADETPAPSSEQKELLKKYSNETLVYHLRYCIEAKLLTEFDSPDSNIILIKDLTPLGHDFIGNIREEQNYSPVKAIAKKAGVKTLDAFIDISKEVAKFAIVAALKQSY